MLNPNILNNFFRSEILLKDYSEGDHIDAPAALPDSSLEFLISICSQLDVKNIFEFGSGRSTKALLANNFKVTSLEDDVYWMNKTIETFSESEIGNHIALVKPLTTIFLGLFPVLDWKIDNEIAQKISVADLILVDSPYYTPFRESTLWSALMNSKDSIVILDDTRIPTLRRFCDRISSSNYGLLHSRIKVGHHFDIFYNKSQTKVRLNHSFIDIIKGWSRYVKGLRFYNKLGVK